jgi:hypothetical protein
VSPEKVGGNGESAVAVGKAGPSAGLEMEGTSWPCGRPKLRVDDVVIVVGGYRAGEG